MNTKKELTGLEEKLEELGYSINKYNYVDDIDGVVDEGLAEKGMIILVLNEDSTKVEKGLIPYYEPIATQEEINDIQSSYDEMKKDLNTLKELGYYD